MTRAVAYTDASLHIAAGRQSTGYGVLLLVNDRVMPQAYGGSFSSRIDIPDSVTAEIWAGLAGVWYAKQRGADRVTIKTDSRCLVRILERVGTARHASLWWDSVAAYGLGDMAIRGELVKGHGDGYTLDSLLNNWCHQRAHYEMRKQRRTRNGRQVQSVPGQEHPDATGGQ